MKTILKTETEINIYIYQNNMDLAELNTKIIAHHTSCLQNKYNISDCIFFLPDLKKCKSNKQFFFTL